MRAMAHPLRLRIVGSLRLDGPATASGLARRLGTDSGQTSHHLRLLARAGFVVDAPELGKGPRGRERWWRAAQDTTSWDDLANLGPEGERAVNLMESAVHQVWREMADDFQVESRRGEWDSQWRAAASSGDYPIRTTPQGLAAMTEELRAVIARHDLGDEELEGSESIVVLLQAFPRKRVP